MSVDAKGRTSVPARFRDALDETFPAKQAKHLIVVPWFDGNLRIFPRAVWEQKQASFDGLFQSQDIFALDELDSDLRRFLYGMALDLMIDAQGRVLLSADLRAHAGVDRDVYWVSIGNMLEVWAPERFSARFEHSKARVLRASLQERLRGQKTSQETAPNGAASTATTDAATAQAETHRADTTRAATDAGPTSENAK